MKKTFQVINDLVDEGVIKTYALGGAIAAVFYVEAFQTEDIDVFIPISVESSGLISILPIIRNLEEKGYYMNGPYIQVEGWDVQFLPIDEVPLLEEAVSNALNIDLEGTVVRVMSPEYLVAVMLNTGRHKDFARVKMFFDQKKVNEEELKILITRFRLEERWQKYRLSL